MTPTSVDDLDLVPWAPDALAQATGGAWHGSPPASIQRIVTDTRHVRAGDAFLALHGNRFDGHEFATVARDAGATALIVSRPLAGIDTPQLVVSDTRRALGHLGAARREAYPDLVALALTGSSGKTTTKEMLGSILRQSGPTLITRGNLNNDLGVPLMLLELTPDHHFAVLELGANHAGEIAYTAALVKPQAVAVLNIGTAHMGEFGGREGIARAKSEIFSALPDQGVAVIPTVDDFATALQSNAAAHPALRFGDGGDVYATDVALGPTGSRFTLHLPSGSAPAELPFAGRHNVDNALAAAALAHAVGLTLPQIVAGLKTAPPPQGRLNFHQLTRAQGQRTLIDDTYNANPHAMRAAARVLADQPVDADNRLLIMGEIGELGDDSESEHAALGRDLSALPLTVWAVGAQAAAVANRHTDAPLSRVGVFADKPSAARALDQWLAERCGQNVAILIKGSRFTRMETLIHHLLETC